MMPETGWHNIRVELKAFRASQAPTFCILCKSPRLWTCHICLLIYEHPNIIEALFEGLWNPGRMVLLSVYVTHLACPATPGTAELKGGRGIQQCQPPSRFTQSLCPCAFTKLFLLLGFFSQSDKSWTSPLSNRPGKQVRRQEPPKQGKKRTRRRRRLQPMLTCWLRNEEPQRKENLNTPTLIPSLPPPHVE